MHTKTKIVVIKLKDIFFYATIVILCLIVFFMLYILFQPKATATNSTIEVNVESISDTMHTLRTLENLNELT